MVVSVMVPRMEQELYLPGKYQNENPDVCGVDALPVEPLTTLPVKKTRPQRTGVPLLIYLEQQQIEKFDIICALSERNRTQMIRAMIRQAIATKGAHIATPSEPLPDFELVTIDDAIQFLAPYFGGAHLSKDTIFRHIADGSIVAIKDGNARTGRRRILKASLVAWMARLGKQLESEMM